MNHDLDHVALGLRSAQPVLDVLAGHLGGQIISGGKNPAGFDWVQIRVGANGMVIELLEPERADATDFLVRFLDRHGEGPHHLTFLVGDLAAEIDRLRSLGLDPIGVQLTSPIWKECFLAPSQAHGTVVQVAETILKDRELKEQADSWSTPWWTKPMQRHSDSFVLRRVVLNAPVPTKAAAFFTEVLGGVPDDGGLRWPGGGRIGIEAGLKPAIDRLEVAGLDTEMIIGGTRFVPAATA